MSTTTPEGTVTETESSDHYLPCKASTKFLLGEYTGLTAKCQAVKGEHGEFHYCYSRSDSPSSTTEPSFQNANVVTLKIIWDGEYEG